ncbi:hypothetical protein [Microbacterium sp. YY-01]|uniref:hypothetical protein n=1 Tax=Microbacterium sp. YY-01 TaxID=3421634 RepID=UPI003D16542E
MQYNTRDPEEPTTTHAGWGEGNPQLLVSSADKRFAFDLTQDTVTIGSAADCVLRLPSIDPHHATVTHDSRDEYVVTLHGEGEMNASPATTATPQGERSEIMRTGARFTAGPWTFVFTREEFADHGRPFGGREGGELSDQKPQPERPDYTTATGDEPRDWEVRDA